MRNVGSIDRFFRAFVGVIFLELAVFWLSGTLQIAAYVDNLFDSVFVVAQDPTIRRYSRPRVSGLQLRYSW